MDNEKTCDLCRKAPAITVKRVPVTSDGYWNMRVRWEATVNLCKGCAH